MKETIALLIKHINLIAITLSPVIAVTVGFMLQRWKLKQDRKFELFQSLMAYRKNEPQTQDLANALNEIVVLWGNNKKILQLYINYHELVKSTDGSQCSLAWEQSFLLLLHAVAVDIGYKHLTADKLQHCFGKDDLDYSCKPPIKDEQKS